MSGIIDYTSSIISLSTNSSVVAQILALFGGVLPHPSINHCFDAVLIGSESLEDVAKYKHKLISGAEMEDRIVTHTETALFAANEITIHGFLRGPLRV